MNLRTALTFDRWRQRQQYRQPGLVARLCKACKLWHFGFSWGYSWREAGKAVSK